VIELYTSRLQIKEIFTFKLAIEIKTTLISVEAPT
jgi:hypothetical protein